MQVTQSQRRKALEDAAGYPRVVIIAEGRDHGAWRAALAHNPPGHAEVYTPADVRQSDVDRSDVALVVDEVDRGLNFREPFHPGHLTLLEPPGAPLRQGPSRILAPYRRVPSIW